MKIRAKPFWDRVAARDPLSGCRLWTGPISTDGYGMASAGRAHRVAWQLTNGQIPAGMLVCHRCDVPLCVNPDHLFLGTAKENTQDMMRKGRHGCGRGDKHMSRTRPESVPRGERHWRARLTEAQVVDARARQASGETQASIAVDLGVSQSAISLLVSRKRWRAV